LIVGVFTAIAVARGPRHHLGHCRSFPGEQKPVLVFEALQAARRDVVLDSRGGLVFLRFSRKTFSHTVSPTNPNPVRATTLSEIGPCRYLRCEGLRDGSCTVNSVRREPISFQSVLSMNHDMP